MTMNVDRNDPCWRAEEGELHEPHEWNGDLGDEGYECAGYPIKIENGAQVRHRETGCPGRVTWHSKELDAHGRITNRYGIDYAGPLPPLELGPFTVAVWPREDGTPGEIATIYVDTLIDWELA